MIHHRYDGNDSYDDDGDDDDDDGLWIGDHRGLLHQMDTAGAWTRSVA